MTMTRRDRELNARTLAEKLLEPYTRGLDTTRYYIRVVMCGHMGEEDRLRLLTEGARRYARMTELREKGAPGRVTRRYREEMEIISRALRERDELKAEEERRHAGHQH